MCIKKMCKSVTAPRALGIDISKWDVSFDPSLTATPPDFVIQRAAFGLVKDSLFDALNVGAQKIPVRGAYHYILSAINWKAQAEFFLSVVKDKGFHFYVCDFEDNSITGLMAAARRDPRRAVRTEFRQELLNYNLPVNLLSVDFAAAAMEWCSYVKAQTGKPVVIYSNISTYQDYLSKDSRAKLYPLWIAWPPTPIPDPQTTNPRLPASRSDWLFWQYSFGEHNTFGPKNGVARTGVDVDVFNGTLEQLYAWAGVTSAPPAVLTLEERVARLEQMHDIT